MNIYDSQSSTSTSLNVLINHSLDSMIAFKATSEWLQALKMSKSTLLQEIKQLIKENDFLR